MIHLRYADHLLHHHMVSYDGVHATFGASSLLYITLLAALRTVWHTPLLPRAVSSIAHWCLFALLVWGFARVSRRRGVVSWFAVATLLCCVMPSATRWLQDGMETSLTLVVVVLWAFWIYRACREAFIPGRAVVAMTFAAMLTLLLRIEFLMFLGVLSAMLFFARRERGVQESVAVTLRVCLGPLLGGLLGAGLVIALMGTLLPDTAVSKAVGGQYWLATLQSSMDVIASSLSFGMGLLLFWLLSGLVLAGSGAWKTLSFWCANCLFPVTLFLAAVRGQTIQGFRYFAWTLLFSLVWNVLLLSESAAEEQSRWGRFAAMALCGVIVLGQVKESQLFLRMFRQRAQAVDALRAQHLEQLHGMRVTAFDIGWIGYFAQSDVCDVGGLVSGREWAKLPVEKRAAVCISDPKPGLFFVNEGYQIYWMRDGIPGYTKPTPDYVNWKICGEYNMANVTRPDWHYLIAPPELAPKVCAATGQQPRPITELLPPTGGAILHRSE